MKANELMIGDWVHVEAHRGFNAQNVKVETIPDNDGDYKYGHHYGHIGTWLDGGDNDFRDVEAKHLQPIPLTPEILEKNGFRVVFEGEFHVCYFQDIGRFHVEIKVDKVGIFQKLSIWDGFGNKVTIIECRFVHQLQHALRLCGINHEIIL